MEFCITESRQEIKALLISNIKECLLYLIPDGKFCQGETYLGNLNGNQMMIKLTGSKAGNWRNFTTGNSGDIIDLWILATGKSNVINLIKEWPSKQIVTRYVYFDENNKTIIHTYLNKNNNYSRLKFENQIASTYCVSEYCPEKLVQQEMCSRCKSGTVVKSGYVKDKQRYTCKVCDYNFTACSKKKCTKLKYLKVPLYISTEAF